MARSNTRFRLQKVLAETGGSFVYFRRLSAHPTRSATLNEELAWLERPEVVGFYAIDTIHRLNDGWWEYRLAISDPNVAFEFKMKFG